MRGRLTQSVVVHATQLQEQKTIADWASSQVLTVGDDRRLRKDVQRMNAQVKASAALWQRNIHRAARDFSSCTNKDALNVMRSLTSAALSSRPAYSRREWRELGDLITTLHVCPNTRLAAWS